MRLIGLTWGRYDYDISRADCIVIDLVCIQAEGTVVGRQSTLGTEPWKWMFWMIFSAGCGRGSEQAGVDQVQTVFTPHLCHICGWVLGSGLWVWRCMVARRGVGVWHRAADKCHLQFPITKISVLTHSLPWKKMKRNSSICLFCQVVGDIVSFYALSMH